MRKIYTLNPTRFSLPCIDGDFDEHELGKNPGGEKKRTLFGAAGINPKAISIMIHLEGLSTYHLSTRVIPQDDSRLYAPRQLCPHL